VLVVAVVVVTVVFGEVDGVVVVVVVVVVVLVVVVSVVVVVVVVVVVAVVVVVVVVAVVVVAVVVVAVVVVVVVVDVVVVVGWVVVVVDVVVVVVVGIVQLFLQESLSLALPSSHCSHVCLRPSPQNLHCPHVLPTGRHGPCEDGALGRNDGLAVPSHVSTLGSVPSKCPSPHTCASAGSGPASVRAKTAARATRTRRRNPAS
jgi:hypothetical protein